MGPHPEPSSSAKAGFTSGSGAAKAILSYAPSRFIEPILGLISLPFLTRALGVEGFGTFSIVFLTATMLRTIGFDWIANCALRFRVAMKDDSEEFFSNIISGLAASLVLAFFLALLFRGISLPNSILVVGTYIWWILADSFVSALAFSGEMVLRADQNPRAFSYSRVFQGLSKHVFGVGALILTEGSIPAYFAARIAGTLLTSLWSWHLFCSVKHLRIGSITWSAQWQFFIFGYPIAFSIFADAVRIMGNRYAVMWLAGPEAMGLYSAAANIGSAPLLIFQQIVMLGLYPLAIKNWENNQSISPIARDGLRYFFILGIPSLTGIAILAKPILSIIAGPQYSAAWPVLMIMASAMFLYGISQYFSLQFLVEKRTWVMAAIGIGAGLLNILLTIFLIPRFGYTAAAYAMLASNFLLLIGFISWSSVSWKDTVPLRSLLFCAIAASAMGATVRLIMEFVPLTIPVNLAGTIMLGMIVFSVVLWRTGEIETEINFLKEKLTNLFNNR